MNVFEFQANQLGRAADDVAGGMLGAKMGLTKVAHDINGNTTLAELAADHSTYTGYAKGTLVWGTPVVALGGIVEVVAAELTFAPTDALGGDQAAFNFWIEDSTAALLLFAAAFDVPIPLNGPLNSLKIQIRYRPASAMLVVLVY